MQLQSTKKLIPSSEVSTSEDDGTPSGRLYIAERKTKTRFLIDSGADLSVLPCKTTKKPDPFTLYAANDTEIPTYGYHLLDLDLGLRRRFRWNFILAKVSRPIIGADFLRFYHLLPDLRKKVLVDGDTLLTSPASATNDAGVTIKAISGATPYHNLMKQYPELYIQQTISVERKHQVVHHITTNGPPIKARPRRLDPQKLAIAKTEFQYLLDMGIIRPSNSSWANPLHMVPKSDGSWRPCGDYRGLNSKTIPDSYPIPYLVDFTMAMAGSTIFSKFDLTKAYYQIPVNEEDISKTAVITPFGLYEFLRMPFGLCNAAQTFQRFMDEVVRGLPFVAVYLDDVLVFSKNPEEHLENLRLLFERFKKFGILINASKCVLGVSELDFLGHHISSDGIGPMQKKADAIKNFAQPSTIKSLRQFLALINFYRKFLPHGAETQHPLNTLLVGAKKNDKRPVPWSEENLLAFERCKNEIVEATILSYPLPNAPLALKVDASNFGMGASLEQFVDNSWKPLGFFSKKFNQAQLNYSTYDRELCAIYAGIKHFKYFLEGRQFKIFTDHKPLIYAFQQNLDKASPRQRRHLDYIAQFSTDIHHISGDENVVADALSRIESISSNVINFHDMAIVQQSDTELRQLLTEDGNYELKLITLPNSEDKLYCDIHTGVIRPYVPESFRKDVFKNTHCLSHSGVRATRKLIARKFFWPGMNKDIANWTRCCISCQRAKITRHTKSSVGKFPICSGRFKEVHIDLVGPLPLSEGYSYLLTCVDRFTKWPEAFPIANIKAETICKAFFDGWVCRFGCPDILISDRGRQFISSLTTKLTKFLGIKHQFTTAYHPQSNGLLERFHRTLKAALICTENPKWTSSLNTVLLGIRTALKEDINASVAELVYGETIKVPGDFFKSSIIEDPTTIIGILKKQMQNLKPSPTNENSSNSKIFISKNLHTCTHVWIRVEHGRSGLDFKYDGPYLVLQRHPKYFVIQMKNQEKISIDRLKPAFILNENLSISDISIKLPYTVSKKVHFA